MMDPFKIAFAVVRLLGAMQVVFGASAMGAWVLISSMPDLAAVSGGLFDALAMYGVTYLVGGGVTLLFARYIAGYAVKFLIPGPDSRG